MKYLERDLINGPHFALCKSEKEYLRETKRLKVKDPPPFAPEGVAAQVIPFTKGGQLVCLVTVSDLKGYSHPQINAILCHEAVHVWQHQEEDMGEHKTSREFEAYCIQRIAQKLMEAYWNKKPYRYSTKPF